MKRATRVKNVGSADRIYISFERDNYVKSRIQPEITGCKSRVKGWRKMEVRGEKGLLDGEVPDKMLP